MRSNGKGLDEGLNRLRSRFFVIVFEILYKPGN